MLLFRCPALALCRALFCLLLCAAPAAAQPEAEPKAEPVPSVSLPAAKPPAQSAAKKHYAGKGVLADMPENWRVVESKNYVIFVSPDENLMVSAQSLDLGSDNREAFVNAAKAIMEAFKGNDFWQDGDSAGFAVPGDAFMTLNRIGGKALLLTIQGDGPDLNAVIDSIRLE